MSLAVLFPGQGSQAAGMLPWLDEDPFARPVLAQMESLIGKDWRQRCTDPVWLSSNRIAQCLLTGVELAAWHALLGAGLPRAAVIAGYSVGELAAFSAAGVFDVGAALRLAQRRAELMDLASQDVPGTLLSASGRTLAQLAPALAHHGFEVAIEIGADRLVLGGPLAASEAFDAALTALGATVQRLPIQVASHTAGLAEASSGFSLALEPLAWRPPATALIANYTGARVQRPADLKTCLAQQISHKVRWLACLQAVAERRPSCVIEVGPGAALTRQWAAAGSAVAARSIAEFDSAANVVAWVMRIADAG